MPRELERLPLSALLSQVLIAFTMEFDRQINLGRSAKGSKEPAPSLAMWANVLRFVGKDGVDERRLPALSGVSKPAVHSMVACLERHGWVAVETSRSDKRAKMVRLTPRGRKLSAVWQTTVTRTESEWRERFGTDAVDSLRHALEAIAGQFEESLPHYPMAISHRGGTPTGL